jgi:iron complex outermembrane receptor protein
MMRRAVLALSLVLSHPSVILPLAAHAEQTAPEVQPLEKITVTGTNIPRVEREGALPVTVFTREDIDRTGATTAVELLQFITANSSAGSVNLGTGIGLTTYSAQVADLRGLGGARTLVLINGKRVDSFAGETQYVGGVNLATVPFSAIERVEILRDGASAIYGSDAIAGVINFIIRQDYKGAEATAYYGAPTRNGGGSQWQGSGAVGFGNLAKDKYNVFASVSYNDQQHLDQVDRNFSNTSYRPEINLFNVLNETFPGKVTTKDIGAVSNGQLAAPNYCAPSTYIPELPPPQKPGCYYDPARVHGVQMMPDDKLWNVFGSGRYQIDNNWQAYLTLLYSHDETTYQIQPVPISDVSFYGPNTDIPVTLKIAPSSPFYPHALAAAHGVDGQLLNVQYRAYENGFRNWTDTNENAQIVVGTSGTWKSWDIDGWFSWNEGKTREQINDGYPLYSRILPLLNSGEVNLFGTNTPDIVAELKAANYAGNIVNSTSKNYGLELVGSKDVLVLPSGSAALALGGTWRVETLAQAPAPVLVSGDLTGSLVGKPFEGSRTLYSFFGELNVPIIETLEGNAAVRYDHYSDFGGTTNPKFSLRWQPTRALLVRASWGTGFLAPSLYQLLIPNSGGLSEPLNDPIRCPVTGDDGIDCAAQFTLTNGGNPNLKPETSEQLSAGLVVDPFAGMSLSIDYFKINLANAIAAGIPVTSILESLPTYGYLVTRAPPNPDFPALPGRIINIDQTYLNLGGIRIQGYDLEGRWRLPATDWGRLTLAAAGTYYKSYNVENPDKTWTGEVSNTVNAIVQGVIPRWKDYVTGTWEYGPWSATLANTYQSSYFDSQVGADGSLRRVGSMSLWDLQGSYAGFKDLKLTLGAKNLFDTNPPLTNQVLSNQVGFDQAYYDPRARFVWGSITYSFK